MTTHAAGSRGDRGEGATSTYSGRIVLKYDGHITQDDKQRIYDATHCSVALELCDGMKCLAVHSDDAFLDTDLDKAITLAFDVMARSAQERGEMEGKRRRYTPAPPPHPPSIMAIMEYWMESSMRREQMPTMMPRPQMPMYKQWCKPPSHNRGSGRSHWDAISVTGTGVEEFEEPPAAEVFAGEPPAAEEVAGEPAGAEEKFDECPIAEEKIEGPPDAAIDDFEEQPKFERPNILGLSAKRHARPKNSESHRPKRKHVLDSYDKPAAPGDDSMWSAAGPEGQVVIAPKQKFAEPLPQTLPLVNFYSFGRETRMVRDHVDPSAIPP